MNLGHDELEVLRNGWVTKMYIFLFNPYIRNLIQEGRWKWSRWDLDPSQNRREAQHNARNKQYLSDEISDTGVSYIGHIIANLTIAQGHCSVESATDVTAGAHQPRKGHCWIYYCPDSGVQSRFSNAQLG